MTVFGLVSAVAGFVKVRYLIDKAIIDNMILNMPDNYNGMTLVVLFSYPHRNKKCVCIYWRFFFRVR